MLGLVIRALLEALRIRAQPVVVVALGLLEAVLTAVQERITHPSLELVLERVAGLLAEVAQALGLEVAVRGPGLADKVVALMAIRYHPEMMAQPILAEGAEVVNKMEMVVMEALE